MDVCYLVSSERWLWELTGAQRELFSPCTTRAARRALKPRHTHHGLSPRRTWYCKSWTFAKRLFKFIIFERFPSYTNILNLLRLRQWCKYFLIHCVWNSQRREHTLRTFPQVLHLQSLSAIIAWFTWRRNIGCRPLYRAVVFIRLHTKQNYRKTRKGQQASKNVYEEKPLCEQLLMHISIPNESPLNN